MKTVRWMLAGLITVSLAGACGEAGMSGSQLQLITYRVTVAGDINEISVTWARRDAAKATYSSGKATEVTTESTRKAKISSGGWERTVTLHRASSASISVGVVNGRTGAVTCTILQGNKRLTNAISPYKVNPQVSCAVPGS